MTVAPYSEPQGRSITDRVYPYRRSNPPCQLLAATTVAGQGAASGHLWSPSASNPVSSLPVADLHSMTTAPTGREAGNRLEAFADRELR